MTNFHDDMTDAPQQATDKLGESQAPLLLQDMQSPEEAFGMPKSRRTSQAVIVCLLLAGAVTAIFAMRHFGMGPSAALAGVELEYKPDESARYESPARILAQLERSRTAVQVPVDHITQDPFELNPTDTSDPEAASREALRLRQQELEAARARRQAEITAAIGKLELQSVMQGRVPVARINGEICRIGSPVGDRFVVETIESRHVTLLDDNGERHKLSLDETNRPGGRRNR